MLTPRSPQKEELPKIIDFLNSHLRPNCEWSISEEYPMVLSDSNLDNIRIIEEKGEILSHAVTRILLIKSPLGLFKIAAIGSVVTKESERHRGYSTAIIEKCCEEARLQGCDFAILWTDIYSFYEKLGFELGGTEISFDFHQNLDVPTGSHKFLNSSKVDPQAILRLYNRHTIGSLRNVEEIRRYLNIPNTQVYTAWDSSNVLKAYAVTGRGADLTNYVHEWGGDVPDLISLLAKIYDTKGQNLTLITGAQSANLNHQLQGLGIKAHMGFLGMIKILDVRNLFFKILRRAHSLGLDQLVLKQEGANFYFGYGTSVFRTDREQDLVRLIFGPLRPAEIHPFDAATENAFNKIFPIPMWIWGWDSV